MKTPKDYLYLIENEGDFLKKIDIRQEFKTNFPNEFELYMKGVALEKARPALCGSCIHYISPNCELNLWPKTNKYLDVVSYTCSSFQKK